VFHSTPTTFISDGSNKNIHLQKTLIRHVEKFLPDKQWYKNLWLVKPEGMNRGRGIEVFNNLKDIMNFVGSKNPRARYVIQKYIERPMLYHSRKFDIRVWALFTGDDTKVYFYKRGYLRTSSDEFTTRINDNKAVHLTNNWFQQHLDNYGRFEDGNTLSFEKFQEYLDETYPDLDINVYDHFLTRIKDIVIDVYLSGKDEFNKNKRDHWFELFGFDFMIDEDFRVWLIEWNTNPYFGIPNKFIADLLPRMISEMFEIILDPIYPPKRKYPLPEKNFELIYSSSRSMRRPFNTPLYPIREPEKYTPPSRVGVRSKTRKSRMNYKRGYSVAVSKVSSVPKTSETRSKKAMSNLRKHGYHKSAAKVLERAYLSSGWKTKSPNIKNKTLKMDLLSKINSSDNTKTITPRNKLKNKGNLQISVSLLTDELLSGKATGEYKLKNFQIVMNRILQKIETSVVLLNKTTLELSHPKNEYFNSKLPSINETEQKVSEAEEKMDLKGIKNMLITPIWESLEKLAKSKYIVKIGEQEGGALLGRLVKQLKCVFEDQTTDWTADDERKEQLALKIEMVKAIWEIILGIVRNDKILNLKMDDEGIDIIIDVFMWANKYKENNATINKIHDILIQILCWFINNTSTKFFISNGVMSEMGKLKKKAISHGILGILIYLYDLESTDFTAKRLINTKILSSIEIQDFIDQLSILKPTPNPKIKEKIEAHGKENKTQLKTLQKVSPQHSPLKAEMDPHLTVTGSTYQSLSPRNDSEYLVRGIVNPSIQKSLNLLQICESLEKHIGSLETKQKIRSDEENRKRKLQEIKKNQERQMEKQEKRFKTRRYFYHFMC
jgi:hypothetical protein